MRRPRDIGRSLRDRWLKELGYATASVACVVLAAWIIKPWHWFERGDGDTPDLSSFQTVNSDLKADALVPKVWREAAATRARKRDRLPFNLPRADGGLGPGPTPRADATMAHFYAALRDIETGARIKPVTVLHLGDSHIASDRFTGDLRTLLQERFGNAGRGLMMPGFPFPHYNANGVRFAKSAGWTARSSLRKHPGPYGVTGVKLTTRSTKAWLRLTSTAGAFEWADVSFLASPKGGKAIVTVDEVSKTVNTRAGEIGVKTIRVRRKSSRLKVTSKGGGTVTVLSWAIGHDRPGLRYVNLGIPSATAYITRKWDDTLIEADLERLKPDLVILGYGTNEGFNDGLKMETYEARVTELMERLQRYAPSASYMVLGPADGNRFPRYARRGRSNKTLRGAECRPLTANEKKRYRSLVSSRSKQLARWHPPPKLDAVRKTLGRIAGNTGAKFWDWSKVMGGPCGIHDWATSDPRLALSDHVHISAEGGRRTADALFAELMKGFEAHRRVASR